MDRRQFIAASAVTALSAKSGLAVISATPPQFPTDCNNYILDAVKVCAGRKGGGYGGPRKHDMSYTYTRNLDYNGKTISQYPSTEERIRRDRRYVSATMCVAGACEVLIEAIKLIHADYPDVYKLMPAEMWSKSIITSIKPYIFVQEDSRNIFRYKRAEVPFSKEGKAALARGTAHAFSIFNIGEELPFSQLKAGDVINLNRASGGGHSVILCGFISHDNKHVASYSPDVIGFEYFSAQGPKIGGGFDWRDAYFDGPPGGGTAGHKADPGKILRQQSRGGDNAQKWLNSGRLWYPDRWRPGLATDHIRDLVTNANPGNATRALKQLEETQGPIVADFDENDEE